MARKILERGCLMMRNTIPPVGSFFRIEWRVEVTPPGRVEHAYQERLRPSFAASAIF
jgi:hypothetical protein